MIYPLSPPLMELLILSIIEKEDSYGYQISQQLKIVSDLKDSTLYPVLRRLSEYGFVQAYDRQYQGRNRKYYRITEAGKQQCRLLEKEWQNYTNIIGVILRGENAKTGGVEL